MGVYMHATLTVGINKFARITGTTKGELRKYSYSGHPENVQLAKRYILHKNPEADIVKLENGFICLSTLEADTVSILCSHHCKSLLYDENPRVGSILYSVHDQCSALHAAACLEGIQTPTKKCLIPDDPDDTEDEEAAEVEQEAEDEDDPYYNEIGHNTVADYIYFAEWLREAAAVFPHFDLDM